MTDIWTPGPMACRQVGQQNVWTIYTDWRPIAYEPGFPKADLALGSAYTVSAESDPENNDVPLGSASRVASRCPGTAEGNARLWAIAPEMATYVLERAGEGDLVAKEIAEKFMQGRQL